MIIKVSLAILIASTAIDCFAVKDKRKWDLFFSSISSKRHKNTDNKVKRLETKYRTKILQRTTKLSRHR